MYKAAGASLPSLMAKRRYRGDTFCHFLREDTEEAISHAKLFAEASRFRRLYAESGVAPGASVIIATDYSPESLYAFVGALIGGFVPAFLAPFTERQQLDQFSRTVSGVIDYARPGAIVASPGFARELVPPGTPLVLADEAAAVEGEPERPWAEPAADDIAFMQFSSGTTGLRKGVMLQHRAVIAQTRALLRAAALVEGDLIASWLPIYHDMGLIACLVLPLATGIPIAMQDPILWARQPQRLLDAIERHRATHVWMPNFAFNHLRLTTSTTRRYDLSSVRAFIDCSEPCRAATLDAFVDRFAQDGVSSDMMSTSYAMAEAVFAVTQAPVGRPPARMTVDRAAMQLEGRLVRSEGAGSFELLSCGRMLEGIEARIVAEDFLPVADGRIGQVALRGEYVFEGYCNNADATEAVFHDGWFLTGDLGALVDGELFITGRLKDVIIAYGRNVYAHDIEAYVSAVDGVKPGRVAAFALDNEAAGTEEVVVVAETTLEPALYRELGRRIKQAAIDGLGLSAVRPYPVAPGWLVKTTSGKMSREENREKYVEERRSGAPRVKVSA